MNASALTLRAACGSWPRFALKEVCGAISASLRLSRSARLIRVFGIGPGVVALADEELGAVFLEGVGDVFDSQAPARPSGHAVA